VAEFQKMRADILIHHRDKLEGVSHRDQSVLKTCPKTVLQVGSCIKSWAQGG